jgi:hypothetical protein
MIKYKSKNFNLGTLKKTKVTSSSGLLLILKFAEEIGLFKEVEEKFSSLKQRASGYSVSQMIMSILALFIKGGDRLSDINILFSEPGFLDILQMSKLPNANTLGGFARRFSQRDIFNLAELVMKLSSIIIKLRGLKQVIIDIDSSLIKSKVEIARKCYEGFKGFNPLMGIIKYGKLFSMAGFSMFRPGNSSPQANNLSLLRKTVNYLRQNNPGLEIIVRIDSAGYNHRVMRFCDAEGIEFVISGDKYDILLQTILRIKEESWEALNRFKGKKKNRKKRVQKKGNGKEKKIEEVSEGVHFVGPEKGGAAYRFVVVRKKNEQRALFPQYEYSYRIYFTNGDRDKHKLVRLYRQRGDAENVIKEEKEGFGVENILSEDYLANAVFFQLQLLAYNLVQYFKYANLEKNWWNLRIKQLRYRLINIIGVVVTHSRDTILRLPRDYRYRQLFIKILNRIYTKRVVLLI